MPPEPTALPPKPDSQRVQVTASGEALRYPAGSLVLLAGLPGAGKSTLLARLYAMRGDETEPVAIGDVRVIDSYQSRNRWAPRLALLPPRARTPLVQATHVWRIARAVLRGNSVIAHTRGTWPHILYGFAALARYRGAGMHLILLDVPPQTARAGQRARGRSVTAATFLRHCRRWRRLIHRARTTGLRPAAGVTVLTRETADHLRTIRFTAH